MKKKQIYEEAMDDLLKEIPCSPISYEGIQRCIRSIYKRKGWSGL